MLGYGENKIIFIFKIYGRLIFRVYINIKMYRCLGFIGKIFICNFVYFYIYFKLFLVYL